MKLNWVHLTVVCRKLFLVKCWPAFKEMGEIALSWWQKQQICAFRSAGGNSELQRRISQLPLVFQRKQLKAARVETLSPDNSLAASEPPSGWSPISLFMLVSCQQAKCPCRFTSTSCLMGCFGIGATCAAGNPWACSNSGMSQKVWALGHV